MAGGSDSVTLEGVKIGDLDVKDEADADPDPKDADDETLTLDNSSVTGRLKVRFGQGDDQVKNKNGSRVAKTDIKTDGGADDVDEFKSQQSAGASAPLDDQAFTAEELSYSVFCATDSQQWCRYANAGPFGVPLIPISQGTPPQTRERSAPGGTSETGGGTGGTQTGAGAGRATRGGESLGTTTAGPRGVGAEEPSYCGPDVTLALLAALQRVHRRMKDVPDSNKGPWDGPFFPSSSRAD
jgi:hypothetical protein